MHRALGPSSPRTRAGRGRDATRALSLCVRGCVRRAEELRILRGEQEVNENNLRLDALSDDDESNEDEDDLSERSMDQAPRGGGLGGGGTGGRAGGGGALGASKGSGGFGGSQRGEGGGGGGGGGGGIGSMMLGSGQVSARSVAIWGAAAGARHLTSGGWPSANLCHAAVRIDVSAAAAGGGPAGQLQRRRRQHRRGREQRRRGGQHGGVGRREAARAAGRRWRRRGWWRGWWRGRRGLWRGRGAPACVRGAAGRRGCTRRLPRHADELLVSPARLCRTTATTTTTTGRQAATTRAALSCRRLFACTRLYATWTSPARSLSVTILRSLAHRTLSQYQPSSSRSDGTNTKQERAKGSRATTAPPP